MFAFENNGYSGQLPVSIKVIGVGGAGGNAVNSMVDRELVGIEFVAANTDVQALSQSKAQHVVQLGVKLTKGLGAGANPDMGKRAAEEDIDKIISIIGSTDIVFLTGGMGGGTGSGALPIIAHALRDRGVLTIAIVTRPFAFEGKRRERIAQAAIEELAGSVDTLIVIPNQKLLDMVDKHVSMIDSFDLINTILYQSIKGIADIITKSGHINVDFADLKAIMKDMGLAVMGTGIASGADRARVAAQNAVSSPLFENMSILGARGVLLNITGGQSLGLHEIHDAASVIYDQVHEDANIIVGSVIDAALTDQVIVTVVATGFDAPVGDAPAGVRAASTTAQQPVRDARVVRAPASAPESATLAGHDIQDDLDVPAYMRRERGHIAQ